MNRINQSKALPTCPILKSPLAKHFEFSETAMAEALEVNDWSEQPWTDEFLRRNWSISRGLLVLGMLAEGKSLKETGKRFGITPERVRQLSWRIRSMIRFKLAMRAKDEPY